MKYEILLNSMLRLPSKKAFNLLEEYQRNEDFKTFSEQRRVLDILMYKANAQRQIKKDVFQNALVCLNLMSKDNLLWNKQAFEDIKCYPMIVWIECIGMMDSESIMSLLKNYQKELTSSLIETCIINLPEDMQLIAIKQYKNKLNPKDIMFSSFYYSVSDNARIKLKEYFPNDIDDDILLELKDLDENEVLIKLVSEHERIVKIPADDLIEFILLKFHRIDSINKCLELFSDKVNECSISKFQLLFTRYLYLVKYGKAYLNNKEDSILLSDSELFDMFKDKLRQIGIAETLSLFDNKSQYDCNNFSSHVVLEFIDIAYADCDLSDYINDDTLLDIINKFVEKCNSKRYTIEDFKQLVNNIDQNGKKKLVSDDYIEAIIACGKLLKEKLINDKNPLFLELRNKFTSDILGRCQRDGTYLDDISLNGLFYRLAKGSMPFDIVYMTKTYKGLIYLSKCGQIIEDPDYITVFLKDEQLAKLNITPAIRWCNTINRTNTIADNSIFVERMGLQLLCFFGQDKGKYLLESDMQGNRMENLFDGLKYENISINEKGIPNINEELINYLFGRGTKKEPNSVINRMIREEIPEFERYFIEFCNSFSEVKKACNGLLTVKRIIRYFENIDLPLELKPDELEFKHALREMNTRDSVLLSEAIQLCKDARKREYSSIPKVEGEMGDFTYKILDLNDPLAIAVGYLTHCCFVVGGISYSSLKHSMQSVNGRTFVVYYKGKIFAESWVWRNGDIICFDSVEAGSLNHGVYKDELNLVEVYKKVANDMLCISQQTEDEIQRVKAITIGKSDYIFDNLKEVEIDTPRTLEKNVYVVDSNIQRILAGDIPEKPRYGPVGVKYKDHRRNPVIISDTNNIDIDTLDEVILNINSLRYQINKEECPVDLSLYSKIISGDGWYILVNYDGSIESGALTEGEDVINEYNRYLSKYGDYKLPVLNDVDTYVKRLVPLNEKKIGDVK